jgi:hypothetical protein
MAQQLMDKMRTTESLHDEKIMMTRPDGNPAMVPGDLVMKYQYELGYKVGYSEKENRQRQIENRVYQEELAKALQKKQMKEDKELEAAARLNVKEQIAAEIGE